MTDKTTASGLFKAVPKTEKGDATTRAAWEIIERERAERDAKTARLKTLRLAREAEELAAAPAPAKKPAAKKAAPKAAGVKRTRKAS